MKKIKLTTFLLFVFLIISGFFKEDVFAATEVTRGCHNTTVVFNSPLPDQTFKLGDVINFSGGFTITSCVNALLFSKVSFYITEDKDIPITDDCNSTIDVFLAQTKVKVYKLGEINPYYDYPNNIYWVEYNQYFTIPKDLGFSGPVRFYVQYSGIDTRGKRHWNIAYQKGTIIIPFDLSATSLDIRTFICKNKNFDLSYLNEYLSKNPNYMFAPSTTYAEKFYNEVAKNTCPESQRNRPVEFSATAACLKDPCPPYKLRISIQPVPILPSSEEETKTFETTYNSAYQKSLKGEYIFDKPYDYRVTACVIYQQDQYSYDENTSNDCKTQILKVFDYMCLFGFCAQNQRDIENPSSVLSSLKYKILKVFGDTDSPCRFWRNEICRAGFSF